MLQINFVDDFETSSLLCYGVSFVFMYVSMLIFSDIS